MPKYNHGYEEVDGIVYEHWTDRSGNGHRYVEIEADDVDEYGDSEYDEGCAACGNPNYPACKTSCPLYDD